jgi:hypothetical protein
MIAPSLTFDRPAAGSNRVTHGRFGVVYSHNASYVQDLMRRPWGLGPLAKVPKLIDLDLGGTQVTLAGLGKFQQALPNCRVRFSAAPQRID